MLKTTASSGQESEGQLKPRLRHAAAQLLVIGDRSSISWITEGKPFSADGDQGHALEPLPSYAPALNPVEGD